MIPTCREAKAKQQLLYGPVCLPVCFCSLSVCFSSVGWTSSWMWIRKMKPTVIRKQQRFALLFQFLWWWALLHALCIVGSEWGQGPLPSGGCSSQVLLFCVRMVCTALKRWSTAWISCPLGMQMQDLTPCNVFRSIKRRRLLLPRTPSRFAGYLFPPAPNGYVSAFDSPQQGQSAYYKEMLEEIFFLDRVHVS